MPDSEDFDALVAALRAKHPGMSAGKATEAVMRTREGGTAYSKVKESSFAKRPRLSAIDRPRDVAGSTI